MNQPTNMMEALRMEAFLEEGLNWVNAWTPTEINSGGCGVFARVLYDKLKSIGLSPEIVVIYFQERTGLKAFNNFLKDNSNVNGKTGEDHILIKLGDVYLDSTGVQNMAIIYSLQQYSISRQQLDLLVDKGGWNPIFDKECEPFIKQKLDEMFDKEETFTRGCFEFPKDKMVRYTDHTLKELKRRKVGLFNSLFQ